MKTLLAMALSLTLTTGIASCNPQEPAETQVPGQPEAPGGNGGAAEGNAVKITAGNAVFTATLTDNATAAAFRSLLPMEISMTEHAGNEKFYDLDRTLPIDAVRPGEIRSGDIMLYGSRTVVLFYRTFRTSYSYTRIGRINDPAGLGNALGSGSVTVKFEPAE